jgi:pyrroloquinoline quinone biosynthesis protein B
MGHLCIGGPGGSLEQLSQLPIERKVYIHINNTNPILLEDSPERCEVERSGMEVATDGLDVEVPAP